MNAREIRQALREEVHVIVRFPEAASGARVFDAREKNGVLEVKMASGWKVANGATIYEA
jgi:hypothetical protein